ncbi:hypothetical protein M9Y10_024149 [Tritrichomonas musculus]|uniref:Right handed beta helix domain-containing protein n=1 Tax=Tritrichomonas musculus TaxID=1915356 RepID=A0ABR2KX34_9EUKA
MSPLLLSKSPVLNLPNFYMSKSTFSSLYLSKFLVSKSFCSLLYLLNPSIKNVSFKSFNVSNFLSQAFYIVDLAKCDTVRKEQTGAFQTLSFGPGCFANISSLKEGTVYQQSGGACCFFGIGYVDFKEVFFYNCDAQLLGGAVFLEQVDNCMFNNCTFKDCYIKNEKGSTATYGAGIAIVTSFTVIANELIFTNNRIDKSSQGCAVYLKSVNNSQITSSTFQNHKSCLSDIGFDLMEQQFNPSYALITQCCFDKEPRPISSDLDPRYDFWLTFVDNSIYSNTSYVYSFDTSVKNHHFITSNAFVNSYCIFSTLHFTESHIFTPSKAFTSSSMFSQSSLFSSSSIFSKTIDFSSTSTFTSSIIFSSSTKFSISADFSDSSYFTPSKQFSTSNYFSESLIFSNTKHFSSTSDFSFSNYYTNSADFTQSEVITQAKSDEPLIIDSSSDESFNYTDSFSASNTVLILSEKGTKLSKGGIAGIVIACIVLLAIIIALIAFFLHRKKSAFIPPEDDPMNIDGLEIPVNMYD